jgi:hypothetical protein
MSTGLLVFLWLIAIVLVIFAVRRVDTNRRQVGLGPHPWAGWVVVACFAALTVVSFWILPSGLWAIRAVTNLLIVGWFIRRMLDKS